VSIAHSIAVLKYVSIRIVSVQIRNYYAQCIVGYIRRDYCDPCFVISLLIRLPLLSLGAVHLYNRISAFRQYIHVDSAELRSCAEVMSDEKTNMTQMTQLIAAR